MAKQQGFKPIAQERGIEPIRLEEKSSYMGGATLTTWQFLQQAEHGAVPVSVIDTAFHDSSIAGITSYEVPLFRIAEFPNEEAERTFLLDLLLYNRYLNFFGIGLSQEPIPEKQVDMSYTMRSDMPRSTHLGILALASGAHGVAIPRIESFAVTSRVILDPVLPAK